MRTSLLAATVSLVLLAGCSSDDRKTDGDAAPAGDRPTTTAPPSSDAPSASSPGGAGSTGTAAGGAGPGTPSEIRRTDWANVTIRDFKFLGLGDVTFRGGKATANHISCTMLPGGAKPAYAEFLAEEPANAPSAEDAVVLVECGSDAMQQALVLVQLAFDQRTRHRAGLIEADVPPTATGRMTFESYSVDRGMVVTTIRRPDGKTEVRRYQHNGGDSWGRA